MLVIKVSVEAPLSHEVIETIRVQNVGRYHKGTDLYKYKIRKPEGYASKTFIHERGAGHKPLTVQVLNYLFEKERDADGKKQ